MVTSTQLFECRSNGATVTKFCVELSDTLDESRRRIRYLTVEADSKMWRVEEARHDDAWTVVDAKPIDNLRVSFPESRATSPFEETV